MKGIKSPLKASVGPCLNLKQSWTRACRHIAAAAVALLAALPALADDAEQMQMEVRRTGPPVKIVRPARQMDVVYLRGAKYMQDEEVKARQKYATSNPAPVVVSRQSKSSKTSTSTRQPTTATTAKERSSKTLKNNVRTKKEKPDQKAVTVVAPVRGNNRAKAKLASTR